MTLVACVIPKIETYPILIGDILITSENQNSASITTHNHEEIDLALPKDLDARPVDLRQKIYVITEYISVALTGYESELKTFLQDFRIYAKYSNPNHEFISNYVNDPERKALVPNSIAMILYYEKKQNFPGNFGLDFLFGENSNPPKKFDTDIFGSVFSAGSGKKRFNELVQDGVDASVEDLRMNAIMNCLMLIASCVGAEKVLPTHTIKNYWGAGFELIFFEQSFRHLEDVAYVICRGTYNDEGDILFPKPDFILFQKYHKGHLLIYAINIFSGFADEVGESMRYSSKKGEFRMDIWEIPSIDNIDESVLTPDLDFSFYSNRVGICYAILTEEKTHTFPNVAIHDPRTSVEFKNGNLEILILKSTVTRTREFAKNKNKKY